MFSLSKLLNFENITIQCHDNPDADAIASAFAVYTYFVSNGKAAKIAYSGKFQITKSNLLEMISKLSIPLEYIKEPVEIETLVVVDGQYGAGNVTKLNASTVAVIDHHREEKTDFHMGVINSGLGSCSTLVWDLLRNEQFPFAKYPDVSTALYYGLYTDTNSLSEIHHPLDKDMRDVLAYNKNIIKRLQNSNLSLNELNIAGMALTNYKNNTDLGYAIFKAEPCDPNILGFISDLALQVDSINACVIYNVLADGAKLSIRSCAREIMASDFAGFLTADVGSGGGHIDKAGGFISKSKVEALGLTIDSYMDIRTHEYFNSYDVVDAASHSLDVLSMKKYMKKIIPVGFALSTDIFESGTPVLIRTLEGDAESVASEDIYFMVGIMGEVYPIKSEKFNRSYTKSDDILAKDYSYSPTARNKMTGEVKELADYINPCAALGKVNIYAKQLERNTKVFTSWNTESYMFGRPGDYLAVRSEDFNDVYVVRQDIFNKTYEQLHTH